MWKQVLPLFVIAVLVGWFLGPISATSASTSGRLMPEACTAMRGRLATFEPQMDADVRDARLAAWRKALAAA